MTGLDWLLIVVIVIITTIQTFRGTKDFDLVLYEMITVILAAVLSVKWYEPLSASLKINPVYGLISLFVILEIILLIIANLLANYTEFSWPPFDAWLSFIFGLVTSWAILFVLLRIAYLGNFSFIRTELIDRSVIAQEILQFKTFHAITNFLNNIGKPIISE